MTTKFPQPWKVVFVGDAFRVFDVNNRHLFVITADEILNEDEDPKDATVMGYGTDDEINDLHREIRRVFDKGR